jgi:hypothetical protein
LKDGKFTGIWADGNGGGTEIKGTRSGNKIVFSYTYIHKEYGECKGDGTGELSKDGKTMDFSGLETGKYKSGQTWTSKWKAILKKRSAAMQTDTNLQAEEAKNAAVYVSKLKLISSDEIQKLAPKATLRVTGKSDAWSSLELQWPAVTLTINRMDSAAHGEHLQGFSGYAYHLAGEKMDQYTFHLLRQIGRTNHVFGVITAPALDKESREFVSLLAAQENGLIFFENAVCDPQFRCLLGPGNRRDKDAQAPTFKSALERKARSMQVLKEKKLVAMEGLPVIVADEEVKLRTAEEIARRALALYAVAVYSEGVKGFDGVKFLKERGAWDAASPSEKKFLSNQKPTEKDRVVFSWAYEALWTMLWTIGYVDALGFPDKECDARAAIAVITKNPDTSLVKNARLRATAEILDQADLSFRCEWIVRERYRTKKKPEGIYDNVAERRHHSFCWIVRYGNRDWDDVSPDT